MTIEGPMTYKKERRRTWHKKLDTRPKNHYIITKIPKQRFKIHQVIKILTIENHDPLDSTMPYNKGRLTNALTQDRKEDTKH